MESPGKGKAQESSPEFEHFDVLPDVAEDHHYLKMNKSSEVPDSTSRNIQKEWRVLKGNLPESIYVQVYEPRIDLLRAVIIGPAGTPYQDGLFFFDILLPSNYPNIPPKVYYHSHGYRLNPNLYGNGKVCLSLINTWYARHKEEKWGKKTSTILQLLVSIQGLVLNERPYFNEPGFSKFKDTRSGQSESIKYNKNAFQLSCQTMAQIMRNPPQGFEDLTVQHFRERSASILAAVDAYQASSSSSKKFKDNLKILHSNLEKSFGKIFSEDVKEQWKETKKIEANKKMEEAATKKKKPGLLVKIFGCLWI